MGVSILTYNGSVQFGLITDKNMVNDPDAVINRFGHEFEKLVLTTIMEPWDEPLDPEETEIALRTLAKNKSSRH
jgi:hypothetical protein